MAATAKEPRTVFGRETQKNRLNQQNQLNSNHVPEGCTPVEGTYVHQNGAADMVNYTAANGETYQVPNSLRPTSHCMDAWDKSDHEKVVSQIEAPKKTPWPGKVLRLEEMSEEEIKARLQWQVAAAYRTAENSNSVDARTIPDNLRETVLMYSAIGVAAIGCLEILLQKAAGKSIADAVGYFYHSVSNLL